MGRPDRILILGAGVIGAAIAQALGRRGSPARVVDRIGVAPSSSGKGAGFLARDWNDTTPLGPLARRSFDLHRELAGTLDADYGYRPLETFQAAGAAPQSGARVSTADNPDWLDGHVAVHGLIGTTETTAQVHPRLFTEALIADATAHGATLSTGTVTAVRDGYVEIDGEEHPADAIVVAMGPWTGMAGLPVPPIFGLKGSSITLDAAAPAHAVFSEFISADGRRLSPEIYARPDEVYVCGVPSADPLPASPAEVAVDDADCELLRAVAAEHSSALAAAPVTARQACFRSVTRDGLPVIGPVPGVDGVWIATGHGPWGILNAPATGEMVAEMILDGAARTVDAAPFSAARAD